MILQQTTTRATPFMWQFIAFAQVTCGTGYHNVGRVIGTTTGKRDNVIDVSFRHLLMAPVALALLTLVLTTNIGNGKRTSSRLLPCAPVTTTRPAKFRHLLRVGIPIVPMVRLYLLTVSFYISPLFLDVSAVVLSLIVPHLFRVAFTICFFAYPNTFEVLQFILTMIGFNLFSMGFSIESKAIFTRRVQSIAHPLMRVKILQSSRLLLLTLWAVLVSLGSWSVPLNVRVGLSRKIFSTLTNLAVTCQAVFLTFVIVEVLKSGRKSAIALRTAFQWYNVIHGKVISLSSRPWMLQASQGQAVFW